jgi:putative solute:sodium symporter small subunit
VARRLHGGDFLFGPLKAGEAECRRQGAGSGARWRPWRLVTYIISGVLAGWLNQFTFIGFPFGYYMAAQGSLAIFVIEIAVYAYLMNKKDVEYGIREEG